MKEPLVADFLEKFLDMHGLKKEKRPAVLRSKKSSSSNHSTHRLSYRLSQAELLDYSYQQNQQKLSADSSPRNSIYLPLTPIVLPSESSSTTNSPQLTTPSSTFSNSRPSLNNRASRGTSVASIDAAVIQMSS
jgi:hypothetical protein